MKNKLQTDFNKFDKVLDGLLSVPYEELQQKLTDEKDAKAKQSAFVCRLCPSDPPAAVAGIRATLLGSSLS